MLPSGCCVEDCLYKVFKNISEECSVHSWIIDVKEKSVQECFTQEDWSDIVVSVTRLPPPDTEIAKLITRYASLQSVDKIHNYLDTNGPVTSEDVSNQERLAGRWLHEAYRAWANLCGSSELDRNHGECWYTVNLWKSVFDTCFASLDRAYISRGESKSNSTSARKSTGTSKRLRVGHLYDSIFTIDSREVGVAEHSRGHPDHTKRKWASDQLKTTKALHDMLAQLPSPGFAVAGIVTAGWHCQMMRMSYAKGYICVLIPDERRQVPQQVTVSTSRDFAHLLTMVWNLRVMLSGNPGLSSTSPVADLEKELLALGDLPPSVSVPSLASVMFCIPPSVETDEECARVEEYDSTDEECGVVAEVAELRAQVKKLKQQLAAQSKLSAQELINNSVEF